MNDTIYKVLDDAMHLFRNYMNTNTSTIYRFHKELCKNIYNMRSNIIDNCIILFFYAKYNMLADKKPIRSFMGSGVEREDSDYSSYLYYYKKHRQAKDEDMKVFGCPELYKNFDKETRGENIKRMAGQDLTRENFEELKIISKYTIFKYLFNQNIHKSKNISAYDFYETYLPQISDIYDEILLIQEDSPTKHFERGINFFSLEVNCCFEKYYAAAEALKIVKELHKPKLEKMKTEVRHLSNIVYFCDNNHFFQNHIVFGWDKIFKCYDYTLLNACDIRNLVFIISHMINTITSTLIDHFEDMDKDTISSSEVDNFFKEKIGQGQHIISNKTWDELTIKFFRDLYNPKVQ